MLLEMNICGPRSVLRYTDTLPFCCNASAPSAHNFSFAVTTTLLGLRLTADDGRTTYSLSVRPTSNDRLVNKHINNNNWKWKWGRGRRGPRGVVALGFSYLGLGNFELSVITI